MPTTDITRLQEQYPGMEWAGFDPSRWWEFGGLQPEMFPAAGGFEGLGLPGPTAAYPNQPEDWITGTPWEFYESYQGLPSEQQEIVGGWLQPLGEEQVGEAGFGEEPYWPLTFEFPESQIEIPEWLQPLSESVRDFYGERMSPEFTMYSPEEIAASEAMIGRELARSEGEILERMRGRGISGSGLESQLLSSSFAGAAQARQLGRIARATEDERARREAAANLEQYRQAVTRPFERISEIKAGMPGEWFAQMSPYLVGGPMEERIPGMELANMLYSMGLLDEETQRALEAGELNWSDVAQLALGVIGNM